MCGAHRCADVPQDAVLEVWSGQVPRRSRTKRDVLLEREAKAARECPGVGTIRLCPVAHGRAEWASVECEAEIGPGADAVRTHVLVEEEHRTGVGIEAEVCRIPPLGAGTIFSGEAEGRQGRAIGAWSRGCQPGSEQQGREKGCGEHGARRRLHLDVPGFGGLIS